MMHYSKIVVNTCLLVLLFTCCSQTGLSQLFAWRQRFSGSGLTVALNPLNPHSVYAEGGGGRLYASYDRGATWNFLGIPGPRGMRQILVHPSDTLTIFCVGEDTAGLRRSTDYGATWTKVISNYGLDGEALTYDPLHPDTMYAGNFFGGGIYRSLNRGTTWTLIGTVGTNICGLTVRPDSLNIMYAGSGGGKISKSTNYGATWRIVKTGTGDEIPKIEVNRTNPMIAYASNFGNAGDSALHVWKTTNGGESWFPVGLTAIPTWPLSVDLNDPNLAYTGIFAGTTASAIYKTTDGGSSWVSLGSRLPPDLAAWSLKVHPQDTTTVWLACSQPQGSGIYVAVSTYTGIKGIVVDSLTADTVRNGTVKETRTNVNYDLAATNGAYEFAYVDGDSTNLMIHAEAYPYYPKDLQVSYIQDSILVYPIELKKLDVSSISGAVRDTITHLPVQANVTLYVTTSIGKNVFSDSTDGSGTFHFDSLYVSQSSIVHYDSLVVNPSYPYALKTITALSLPLSGLTLQADLDTAEVLIVGAIGGGNYDAYYTNALRDIGVASYAWNTSIAGLPSLRAAKQFKRKTLVYYSGVKHTPLTQSELDSLTSSIQIGCNVMLTGQDIVEKNDTTSLIGGLIGVHFSSNGVPYVKSIAGEITSGTAFALYTGGAQNQTSPDVISPVDPLVKPFMRYGLNGESGIAAVRRAFYSTKNKLVLTGFGFEAIAGSFTRAAVMQKIFTYLQSSQVDAVVNVDSYWNMVSLPLRYNDSRTSVVFPSAASNAFYYNGVYTQQDTLQNGAVYWLKFSSSQVLYPPQGEEVDAETLNIHAGWNAIGSITLSVPLSSIRQFPPDNIFTPAYTYKHKYVYVDSLVPGGGYWIKANVDGQIIVSAFGGMAKHDLAIENLSRLNQLIIADSHGHEQTLYFGSNEHLGVQASHFELPPLPPSGGFDIRFSSNDLVSTYPAVLKEGESYSFNIVVRGASYPMSVRPMLSEHDGAFYSLIEIHDGKSSAEHVMTDGRDIVIRNQEVNTLILKVSAQVKPTDFALFQNYPNPFNPKTDFRFHIADFGFASLKIFDVLGREVATLLNEKTAPGAYTVSWDASMFPSGVYFYRLQTEKFSDVKKLILVR